MGQILVENHSQDLQLRLAKKKPTRRLGAFHVSKFLLLLSAFFCLSFSSLPSASEYLEAYKFAHRMRSSAKLTILGP